MVANHTDLDPEGKNVGKRKMGIFNVGCRFSSRSYHLKCHSKGKGQYLMQNRMLYVQMIVTSEDHRVLMGIPAKFTTPFEL